MKSARIPSVTPAKAGVHLGPLTLAAALAIALVAPGAARAETDRDAVVSTQVWAALTRGLSLAGEHRVTRRTSVVVEGGLRGGALGDYSSTTWMLGADYRWWFHPRHAITIAGPFVGAHVSAARTGLSISATDRPLGTSWTLEQRVDIGWRFTIHSRIALTPTLGFGAHEDIAGSGRLEPAAISVLAFGFELGCLL